MIYIPTRWPLQAPNRTSGTTIKGSSYPSASRRDKSRVADERAATFNEVFTQHLNRHGQPPRLSAASRGVQYRDHDRGRDGRRSAWGHLLGKSPNDIVNAAARKSCGEMHALPAIVFERGRRPKVAVVRWRVDPAMKGADDLVVHLTRLVEGEDLWRSFHRERMNIGPKEQEGVLMFYANSWILSKLCCGGSACKSAEGIVFRFTFPCAPTSATLEINALVTTALATKIKHPNCPSLDPSRSVSTRAKVRCHRPPSPVREATTPTPSPGPTTRPPPAVRNEREQSLPLSSSAQTTRTDRGPARGLRATSRRPWSVVNI